MIVVYLPLALWLFLRPSRQYIVQPPVARSNKLRSLPGSWRFWTNVVMMYSVHILVLNDGGTKTLQAFEHRKLQRRITI